MPSNSTGGLATDGPQSHSKSLETHETSENGLSLFSSYRCTTTCRSASRRTNTATASTDSPVLSMKAAWDTIVLGAGAAGLMCAITAARRGRRVLVLERSSKPGKKILMSGGGAATSRIFTSSLTGFCRPIRILPRARWPDLRSGTSLNGYKRVTSSTSKRKPSMA
jgi:hypothetical protein